MKYLRKFYTEAEYAAFLEEADVFKPSVCYVEETQKLYYNKAIVEGVYIQHLDGKLFTSEEWSAQGFAKEDANGVAIITNDCQLLMNPMRIKDHTKWVDRDGLSVLGVLATDDEALAKTDFNGIENTSLIYQQATEIGAIAPASALCKNYVFPNGETGYLGAAGEWGAVAKHGDKVVEAARLLGNPYFNSTGWVIWTSTQASESKAWVVQWSASKAQFVFSTAYKTAVNNMTAYAFAPLNI